MKTRKIVLIFSLILCLGMLVACNADVAEQKAGDSLAYATFKNDAKEFSVSYDGYQSFDNLYWYYKADKLDAYGQTGDTGDYYAKVPGNSQTHKGLDGKTEALSEGKWQFTLMAFEAALTETAEGSKRYNADYYSASAIYSGYTPASGEDVIVIRRNQTNYIPVTVTPVAGTGHIKFGDTASQSPKTAYYEWEDAGSVSNPDVKITITLPVKTGLTVTDYEITKELSYSTTAENYPISGYIWLNSTTATGTIADSTPGDDYTNDIPAGVYAASIVITPVDDEDNIIFADQNLSLKVFGGLTATISGSLKELLSNENYFAVPEVDVKVFNPKTTSETEITSDYVAKDEKTSEKTMVTFPEGALTSTNQHSLEIEVFSAAVSESKFVISGESKAVAGLDLTLKKVTRTSEGDVKEETVSEFDNNKYATIVTYINPGLEDVAVKYNGNDKDQPIAGTDAEDPTKADVLDTKEGLGYNPATGYLSFKTNHFSEYYVQAKVYVQNVTTGKYYHSLQAAVDDAKDNQTIKLLDDIELTNTLETSKSFELDLNGENISANNCRALLIKEGIVSIFGNGTISANGTGLDSDSSVIRLGSPSSVSNAAKLTIGAAVTVSSNKSYGITVFGYNVNASSVGQELIVDGKVTVTGPNPAISGNGSSELSKTNITINAGAIVSSTGVDTKGRGSAIYHPQAGTLLINGGTVSGPSAIEAKGGDVTIIGGEIKATASSDYHEKNSNGNSTAGYSIVAVKNGDYKGNGNYVISSGTFTGPVDVVEDSAAEFTPTISITGGIFDHNPSAYVADGYVSEALGTNPGTWEVVPTTPQVSVVEDGASAGETMSLASFRNKVNAGNSYAGYTVTLLGDVDLGGTEWTPIGTSTHPFSGKFDGQGNTIFGLKIISDSDYNGLFGFVKSDTPNESFTGVESLVTGYDIDTTNVSESKYTAVVKNVKISDVSINVTGKKYTGAIAGYALNSYVGNCEVLSGKITGYKCTGGIVGTADQSSINNCKVHSDTLIEIKKDSSGTNAGGIVGTVQYLASGYPIFIGNCTFEGTVDCSKIASDQACGGIGGIIAYASALQDKGVVYKCINRGTLKANKSGMVGGICGYGNSMGLFADCENDGKFEITGEVTSSVYGVGGIVGVRNNQAVSFFRCVNDSDITVNSKYLGGLCGYADNGVEVMNCANNGNLVSTSSDPDVRLLVSGPSGADYNGYVIYNKSYEKANEIIEGLSDSGMEFIELRSISEEGTISVPSWVKHIETDDNYNFTISSNIAANHLRLIGSGIYTIAEGSSVNNLVLSGTSFTLTNNGTINGYVEIGGGVTATINNEDSRKIGGVGSVASTPSNVTINNHGLISRNSGDQGNQHTISFSYGHDVEINNYGTIENIGASYVLLSYVGSTMKYNAYEDSILKKTGTSNFIIIDSTGSIAVRYATGSKYDINGTEKDWTQYSPWGGITVEPMQ